MSGDASNPARAATSIAITLVAAVAENGVIGRDGAMPWRLKSDMRHFRAVTTGKPVVMGRKTFESIGKPLAGRTNIVITRDRSFTAPGALAAASLADGLTAARGDALRRGTDVVAVIGGGQIYAEVMPQADRLIITEIHLRPDGNTHFPSIEPRQWRETSREWHVAAEGDDADFSVVVYERQSN